MLKMKLILAIALLLQHISAIVLDPKSCKMPNRAVPQYKFADMQGVVNEAFDMLQNFITMMNTAASDDETSDTYSRIAKVTQDTIACLPGDLLCAKAVANAQRALNLQQDNTITIFCAEMPGESLCPAPTNTDDGLTKAYATKNAISICPATLYNRKPRGGLIVGSQRTQNVYTLIPLNDAWTVSAVLVHELLHCGTFEYQGDGEDGGWKAEVQDIQVASGGDTVSSYGWKNVVDLAVLDLVQQGNSAEGFFQNPLQGLLTLWDNRDPSTKKVTIGPSATAGTAIYNADSMALAIFQLYVINTDFVTVGAGVSYNTNGFELVPC